MFESLDDGLVSKRALLLRAFAIRSETQLMEQLDYNLLYRWLVGLGVDEPVWVPTVFTKNRERLLKAEVAHKFLAALSPRIRLPRGCFFLGLGSVSRSTWDSCHS